MISLKRLLQLTPRQVLTRARTECRVRTLKSVIDIDELGEHKFVLTNVRATDGNRTTAIKFYQLRKRNLVNSEVWLYCSCPYWRYYCEVAVARHGSTSILESNGAFPFIRNPKMVPHLCKHLAAASRNAPKVKARRVKPTADISSQEIDLVLKQLSSFVEGL